MKPYVASKSLATASELLVVGDMRPQLVPIRYTMTYATRLGLLLKTFHEIRKRGLETYEGGLYSGPIDLLQTLYFFQWTVFDDGRRMLLAVKFDRPFETYFRRLVDIGGPVLDAILCHCTEFDGHSCYEGYDGFSEWGRRHQIESHLFAGSEPGLTVDDVSYLKAMEQIQRQAPAPDVLQDAMRRLTVEDRQEKAKAAAAREPARARAQALRVIDAMYGLSKYFPEGKDPSDRDSRDRFFLHRLTKSLVSTFESDTVTVGERETHRAALEWFDADAEWTPPEPAKAKTASPTKTDTKPAKRTPPKKGAIQAGILSPYRDITHGRIALLRFTGPGAGNKLIGEMLKSGMITTNARDVDPAAKKPSTENRSGEVVTNLSLSVAGLRTLGLSETSMRSFPSEFREGMAERAGPLGDHGINNPQNWRLPTDADGREILMTSVDMIVSMRIAADWPARRRPHNERALKSAEAKLDKALGAFKKLALSCGVETMAVDNVRHQRDEDGRIREHFGFVDGIGQPALEARDDGEPNYARDTVRLGEALIGYENDRMDPDKPPRPGHQIDQILDSGTFHVVRKLSQDVDAFHRFVCQTNGRVDRTVIEAKFMGRSRDGKPLVHDYKAAHSGSDQNDYDYDDDPHGDMCPFSAHTRRTNPRTPREIRKNRHGAHDVSTVPRIIRRGFSYGPPYTPQTKDAERGLYFTCYNASIAEQFEVVQRWISGGNITKIYSKHDDPMMGIAEPGEKRFFRFQHDGKTENLPLPDQPMVRLEWGIYLFAPSMAALEILAKGAPKQVKDAPGDAARGSEAIAKLTQYESYVRYLASLPAQPGAEKIDADERACYVWKAALEDFGARQQDVPDDIWEAINTYHGGVLRTPFGTLVGKAAHVKTVLQDKGETYSVRSNWERMKNAIGEHYLGMDPKPSPMQCSEIAGEEKSHKEFLKRTKNRRYQKESAEANKWMSTKVDRNRAFEDACAESRNWLNNTRLQQPDPNLIDVSAFANDVIGRLAQKWYGLPDDGTVEIGGVPGKKPNVPGDLVAASFYFFGPKPSQFVEDEAKERGNAFGKALKTYVRKNWGKPRAGTMLADMIATGTMNEDEVTSALAGATNGFVAPTRGMLMRALLAWMQRVTHGGREGQELWRVQRDLNMVMAQSSGALTLAVAEKALYPPLVYTMKRAPAPEMLHRVAIRKTTLGGVEIEPGERIVLGVGSAARDDPKSAHLLFGGEYKGAKTATAHACPGQELAWGVLLGMTATLLASNKFEPDPNPFRLRLKP